MKLKKVIVPISGMQAKDNGGKMSKQLEEDKKKVRGRVGDLMDDTEFEAWWKHNLNHGTMEE